MRFGLFECNEIVSTGIVWNLRSVESGRRGRETGADQMRTGCIHTLHT